MDRTEVLAIEIKQFVGAQGLRSSVPRVVGQTAKAQVQKSSGKRTIKTEEEFFEALQDRSPTDAGVARKILDWSRQNFSHVNWKGSSFVLLLEYGADFSHNPITVFVGGKVPRVGIKFGRLKNRNGMPEEKRIELLRRLNNIPGVRLSPDSIDKYPNILLSTLANDDALEQFLRAIARTNEEVKATKS